MRMNGKMVSLMTVVFSCMLFLAVGVLTAGDQAVPDEVVISPEENGFEKILKGPVKLSHKKHSVDYKVACTECHHAFKDGKNVWKEGDHVQACKECHKMERTEQDGNKVYKLKNAFHKNCKDCHKALQKEGKKTGPFRKCNDCHEKKG